MQKTDVHTNVTSSTKLRPTRPSGGRRCSLANSESEVLPTSMVLRKLRQVKATNDMGPTLLPVFLPWNTVPPEDKEAVDNAGR